MIDPVNIVSEHASRAKKMLNIKCPVTVTVAKLYAPFAFSGPGRVWILGDWWSMFRVFRGEPHIPFSVLLYDVYHEMYHQWEKCYGYPVNERAGDRFGFSMAARITRRKFNVDVSPDDIRDMFIDAVMQEHERLYGDKFYAVCHLMELYVAMDRPYLIEHFIDDDPELRETKTVISLAGEE